MQKINNQTGTIHLALIGISAILLIVGAGVWVYVRQDSKPSAVKKHDTVQKKEDAPKYTELSTSQIQALDSSKDAKSVPAQQSTPRTAAQSNTPQNAKPTQSTPLATQGKVTFSADGCSVTGTGDPGWTFEVGAYNATLTKGGSVTYTLPASGTLTKSAGGVKNMYAFGKLSNAQNPNILMEQVPISADQCAPAG